MDSVHSERPEDVIARALFSPLSPGLRDALRLRSFANGVATISAGSSVLLELALSERPRMIAAARELGLTVERIEIVAKVERRAVSFTALGDVLNSSGMASSRRRPMVPRARTKEDPQLATGILNRARTLLDIEHTLLPRLPDPLPRVLRMGNLRPDGTLVLFVESSIWHTRMRLQIPQILEVAQSLNLPVKAVKVTVSPRLHEFAATGGTPEEREAAAARALEAIGKLLDKD